MVAVFIRADKFTDSYERKVTDILTLLGDVGGLKEFFLICGELLVGFITQKMFMSSIVKKIYHMRKYDNISHEAKKHFNASSLPLGSDAKIDYDEETRTNARMKGKIVPLVEDNVGGQEAFDLALDAVKVEEKIISTEFKGKAMIDKSDIYSLFFAFLNRSRLDYTVADIWTYIMRCLCYRDTGDLRRERTYKKHFLFEKAEEKFNNELDVVRIVKTLRKFKMLAQALLSQRHRFVLRFQRQNLVETSSSSSDSDTNAYDPVRLMENGNPLVRLVTYGKIKKMMKQFVGANLDNLERNIMRGMFRRKLKDFAELQQENQENVPIFDRLKMGNFDLEDQEEIRAKDEYRRKINEKKIKTDGKPVVDVSKGITAYNSSTLSGPGMTDLSMLRENTLTDLKSRMPAKGNVIEEWDSLNGEKFK
jgi:hypothetical protein